MLSALAPQRVTLLLTASACVRAWVLSPPSPSPPPPSPPMPPMPPLPPYAIRAEVCPGTYGTMWGTSCGATSLQAAVRCCNFDGSCGGSVCSSSSNPSSIPPQTWISGSSATFEQAVAECWAHGMRLCNESEVSACCSTGCNYDAAYVWTSTACPPLSPSSPPRTPPPPPSPSPPPPTPPPPPSPLPPIESAYFVKTDSCPGLTQTFADSQCAHIGLATSVAAVRCCNVDGSCGGSVCCTSTGINICTSATLYPQTLSAAGSAQYVGAVASHHAPSTGPGAAAQRRP